jgi:DNA-binding response OmpR family regulator
MTRLLVIDEERTILTRYRRELRAEGYEVATAVTGSAAIKSFKTQRPDLVILEIKLPGMDGLEIMGHMLSVDRHVPVIIRSAYTHYKENFLSWSASAYLEKSSDLSELKRTIRELLKDHSRNQSTRAIAR